ncbi:MAG TPA: hypothetical protein VNZ45_16400, partial [Bacteroidia bacterium]|nr:hypothetical protein [Bacteroidia bacterium]
DGKVVQDKQIKTDWVEAQILLLGFEVDLQDNIFVMVRVYKQSKGKGKDIDFPETMGHFKEKVLNYENKILRYSKGSNTPKEYSLDVEGKIIGDFFVTYTPKNDFILTGLYYHNMDQDAYEGCVYMRIDAQGNAKAAALSHFPQSLEETASKAIMTKEDKVKYPGPHFGPFDANAEDDGSAIMVCDYRYTIIITHSDGRGNSYTTYEYYNMDITSMKFAPDGSLVWVKSLPLYRRSESNPEVVGQIFFRGKGTYNFVYCDSKKNLMAGREESNDPKKWDSKEYIVELGTLDAATGNIKRSILFDRDKQNIDEQLSFDKSVRIAGLNGVMLAGQVSGVFKGTRYRFVQISMN